MVTKKQIMATKTETLHANRPQKGRWSDQDRFRKEYIDQVPKKEGKVIKTNDKVTLVLG